MTDYSRGRVEKRREKNRGEEKRPLGDNRESGGVC